jgi:hypothetical protein
MLACAGITVHTGAVMNAISVVLLMGVAPPTRDAGSASPDAGTIDAGRPPLAPAQADLEQARKEISALKLRATDLEAKTSRLESRLTEAEKFKSQLEALSARVLEVETQREQSEREVASKKANAAQAHANVSAVLAQLATGNTANVDGWLGLAEQLYSGNAQKLVTLARTALRQGDLANARQYLNLALLESPAPGP